MIHFKAKHLRSLIKLFCVFAGNVTSELTAISENYAQCKTPSHSAGIVTLQVALVADNGAMHNLRAFNFTFVGAMEIAHAAPLVGLARGVLKYSFMEKGSLRILNSGASLARFLVLHNM